MEGRRVKAARIIVGITQSQLAQRCHMPRALLSAVEVGRVLPGDEMRDRIAEAIGMDVDLLFGQQPDRLLAMRAN